MQFKGDATQQKRDNKKRTNSKISTLIIQILNVTVQASHNYISDHVCHAPAVSNFQKYSIANYTIGFNYSLRNLWSRTKDSLEGRFKERKSLGESSIAET